MNFIGGAMNISEVTVSRQRCHITLRMVFQWILLFMILFCITPSNGNDKQTNRGSRDIWSDLAIAANYFLANAGNNRGSWGSYRPSRPTNNYYNRPSNNYINGQDNWNSPQQSFSDRSNVCPCRPRYRKKRQIMNDTDPDDYDENGLNARIVGGYNSRINEYPETVLVLHNGRQHCGGTILNRLYVMTAAHCISKQNDARTFSVIVDAYDLNKMSGSKKIGVSRGIYHPNYNSRTFDNDIALLELQEPIDFSNTKARPACIPIRTRNYDDEMATAVGWGKTSESGDAAKIQQKVEVPVKSNEECQRLISNRFTITENMICAGYTEGGKDACGGDSGGPLFFSSNDGNLLQIGVVSFGEGCARAKRPGVYARVDQETDFLLQNMPNVRSCVLSSPDG